MSSRRPLVISSNTSWSVVNFRADLIGELRARGFEVDVIAPADRFCAGLVDLGARFNHIDIECTGTSPVRDARLFLAYRRLLRRLGPAAYLGFTAKPNIFGGLAAQSLGIPVINNIAGLGTAFVETNWLTHIVEQLYRVALARSRQVFFQNASDMERFIARRIVSSQRARLLPGSGINLQRFSPVDVAPRREFRFLLLGRLLWDKGVGIYVDAARQVLVQAPNTSFLLLGPAADSHRGAVGHATIDSWCREGVISYLGEADDVRPHIASADCVVLPSHYPEGVPRSLLEAAAMARPIITTDTPGCRLVVEDGRTGFLCRPRDPADLAEKMMKMLSASPRKRAQMGALGRVKMEREFNQEAVTTQYLRLLRDLRVGPHLLESAVLNPREPA